MELMRELTVKTLSSMSKMRSFGREAADLRLLAEAEQVRLDAVVLERPHLAGQADAGLHLVEDQQHVVLVAELADGAEELGTEVVVAALALDRLHDERGDVVLALGEELLRLLDARPLASRGVGQRLVGRAGNSSFGLSMRGQSNFGKYCVFVGSRVRQRQRVAGAAVEGLAQMHDLRAASPP